MIWWRMVNSIIMLLEFVEKPYLTIDDIKLGFEKCQKTINRLLNDSELLLKNGRFSSAVALAILAHEEMGKAQYFIDKTKNNSEFSKKEWVEISFSGKAHVAKLRVLLAKKLEIDKEWTERNKIKELPVRLSRLGMQTNFDTDGVREYTTYLFEKIFPALNLVKQDCFYLNWDEQSKKWVYFESRFDEITKKSIAIFLITETKHNSLLQQHMFKLPSKPFAMYNTSDWKLYYSKLFEQFTEIRNYMFTSKYEIERKRALTAIENNYVKNLVKKS